MANALDLLFGQQGRIGTPGINPGAPDPRPAVPPSNIDQFLGTPGGGFLMNLLAQQGFSTTPQDQFGAIGRASLLSRQQANQQNESDLQRQLLESRIGLNRARATGEAADSELPSDVRSFREFEALGDPEKPNVMTPAQQRFIAVKRAQQTFNDPGAGRFAIDPTDPTRTTQIVPEKDILSGLTARSGATTKGQQDAEIAAIAARKLEQERANNLVSVPEKVAATEAFITDGENIIANLKSGELSTGPIRGLFPAITTAEQLFEVYSGAQILEQISSVTLGALSKGEMDFLQTTVSGRTKTEEANIEIIQRKIDIIKKANARALARIDRSPANKPVSEMTDAELEAIVNGTNP